MDRHDSFRFMLVLGFVLSPAVLLLGQRTPDKVLIVNGRTAGAAIRQIDERSYIDIETLAQITNGLVTVETNRIVLTIPVSDSSVTPSVTPSQAT